ncbi:MAG TPA: MarR family winged helix-turn-helix transcriptional regulator [Stellaceae bacterium]|nr:MarR family winged helix-turn-helix transcriptional regulator [Stellaceae bacterium]
MSEAEAFVPPVTTTRPALLVDGSDRLFRELIGHLMTMAQQLQALRAGLAQSLGVSEPEYRVFLAVAQLQGEGGIGVGAVARHLMVTGAFVTMIAQRLVKSGHIEKKTSPADRRGVLLRLTAKGRRLIAAFAAEPQAVNDELFRDIDRGEFQLLLDLARRIVAGGERALMVSRLRALDRPASRRRRRTEPHPEGEEHDERRRAKR